MYHPIVDGYAVLRFAIVDGGLFSVFCAVKSLYYPSCYPIWTWAQSSLMIMLTLAIHLIHFHALQIELLVCGHLPGPLRARATNRMR